jgi:DNA invertase Pin-like site-specific DNA recombinase
VRNADTACGRVVRWHTRARPSVGTLIGSPSMHGAAGATIRVLDFASLDLATPEGRGFLAMFSAMAERERVRIIERTREGRRLAMRKGVKMGPPFKLTEHQRQLAAKRMAAGESTRLIARDFNVSHNTIARLR